jgi:hypothetical protein
MGLWDQGTFAQGDFGSKGTLEPWNFGTMVLLNHWTL